MQAEIAIRRLVPTQTSMKGQEEEEEQSSSSENNILASFPSRGLPSEHDRVVGDSRTDFSRRRLRDGSRVVLAWVF